jgi:hypothetical protein
MFPKINKKSDITVREWLVKYLTLLSLYLGIGGPKRKRGGGWEAGSRKVDVGGSRDGLGWIALEGD